MQYDGSLNCGLAPVRLLLPRSEEAQFHHINVISSMEDPTLLPIEQIQLKQNFEDALKTSSFELSGRALRSEKVVDDIRAVMLHGVLTVSTAYGINCTPLVRYITRLMIDRKRIRARLYFQEGLLAC
jgi:hypothetical protein